MTKGGEGKEGEGRDARYTRAFPPSPLHIELPSSLYRYHGLTEHWSPIMAEAAHPLTMMTVATQSSRLTVSPRSQGARTLYMQRGREGGTSGAKHGSEAGVHRSRGFRGGRGGVLKGQLKGVPVQIRSRLQLGARLCSEGPRRQREDPKEQGRRRAKRAPRPISSCISSPRSLLACWWGLLCRSRCGLTSGGRGLWLITGTRSIRI